MKNNHHIMCLVLTLAIGGCAGKPELNETSSVGEFKRVNHFAINGSTTGDEINFSVYLPPAYFKDAGKDFPVIYHLHGLNDKHNGSQINIVPDFFENLWEKGIGDEAIIVFPDGKTNSMWSDSYDGTKKVETHIVKEIIPFVDANFRTRAGAENRYIQGFSMGGFGALKLIAKYPDLFDKCISFDGALHNWETLSKGRSTIVLEIFNEDKRYFEETADLASLFSLSTSFFQSKKRLFLSYGNMAIVQQFNASAHIFLEDFSITHKYKKYNCNHSLNCFLNNMKDEISNFYWE